MSQMKTTHIVSGWGRLLLSAAPGVGVLLAFTTVMSWAWGWRSLSDYGDVVVVAGAICVLFGIFGLFGGLGEISHRQYQLSHVWIEEALEERQRISSLNSVPVRGFAAIASISGLVVVGIGLWLRTLPSVM